MARGRARRDFAGWGDAYAAENKAAEERQAALASLPPEHTCAEPPEWRFDPRDIEPDRSSGRPGNGDHIEVLVNGGAWLRMRVEDARAGDFGVSFLGTLRAQRLRFDQEGVTWRWSR